MGDAVKEHKNIDILESIVLGEENDMQDGIDICEYDSNTLQQRPLCSGSRFIVTQKYQECVYQAHTL